MSRGPFVIRPATPADADGIAAVYAPFVESTHVTFEETAPSPAVIAERMGRLATPWYVAVDSDDSDAIVGYAYAAPYRPRPSYRWTIECSIYISERAQRQGLGRRFYERLLPVLAKLGYKTVTATTALPNPVGGRLSVYIGFYSVLNVGSIG